MLSSDLFLLLSRLPVGVLVASATVLVSVVSPWSAWVLHSSSRALEGARDATGCPSARQQTSGQPGGQQEGTLLHT